MSFIKEVRKLLSENIRDYAMYIALFVIIGVFTVTTDGLFISSRNIVNLVNQAAHPPASGRNQNRFKEARASAFPR
jgi:putative multiple sugar transport system permease protein